MIVAVQYSQLDHLTACYSQMMERIRGLKRLLAEVKVDHQARNSELREAIGKSWDCT